MSFAAEDQLLIQCSQVKLSDKAVEKASTLLTQGLDWDYILEVSIRHGVAPLFFCGLNQAASVVELDRRVPARIMEELWKLYHGNQLRNQRLYRVLGEIAKAFERTGIQAMGLKDVQLAREVYPNIGMRPMGDIDILIHPEDYSKVRTCMAELGFAPLPSPNIPFTLKYAWAHHFHRQADNVWIDMQWNVLQREWDLYHEGNVDFEIDRMWRGASLMAIDDYQLLVPRPEDMLFHLCMHLEGHMYCELILFSDIVELLRHYENQLDWTYLVEITRKYKAESSVYYVLFLVQRLFDITLPPSLLKEIEPVYFNANLFNPLFGNLTALHVSLDQIRLAVAPPDEVLNEFESAVRRQTLGAIQAYRAIDHIARAFRDLGGELIVVGGASSEKVFPDPSLAPFEDIHVFILDHDLPRMRETLSSYGFKCDDAHYSERYSKQWEVTSIDPAIAVRPTLMALQSDIEKGLNYLLRPENKKDRSKKDVAISSIKAKLGGHEHDDTCVPVQIKITVLSPEELLVALCARLGKQQQERLFGLCSLLEFFRGYSGPLDWQQIASAAEKHGVSKFVAQGLQMVSDLLGSERVPITVSNTLACSGSQPRVLELARYDPASWARYTGFARSFYYLFSFLSIQGTKAKSRYVLKSLLGSQGSKAVLPSLIPEVVTSMFALLRGTEHTTRDFAYWIEPSTALEAAPGSNLPA